MTNERMMELLRAAVGHIKSFEEDEAINVLQNLGFTQEEIAEIQGKENPCEDFIVDEEMICFWVNELLTSKGKTSTDQLTAEEIQEEIEEVDGTISNERMWAHSDPIHLENIANLDAYRERLKEMLEDVNQNGSPEPAKEWRIVMVSEGGTKHHFMGGYASENEANIAAEAYSFRYVDENCFEWRLEVEEDTSIEKDGTNNGNV